jgi:hypothetical protein
MYTYTYTFTTTTTTTVVPKQPIFGTLDSHQHGLNISHRVKSGLNTSTVTLRVVGGDENGSLKSETVKYG